MLYLPFSKIVDSSEALTAPGASITAEGQALIRATGAQYSGVTVSAGAAGEVFAGFSIMGTSAAPLQALYATKVETFVVPGSGIVALSQTPVAGQVFVFDTTTNTAVATPTVSGSNVSGLTAGDTVSITYKYALSVVQARALQGDVQPGGYVGTYVGQVGLVKRGVIYTDQFDSSVNWMAATSVKLAANGQLTDQSGSGVVIPAAIIAVPGVEVPFLGLEFSAV